MAKQKQPGDKFFSIQQVKDLIAKVTNDLLAGKDPGNISFCLKPMKKVCESYFLQLTQRERDSMIHCTRIRNRIKDLFYGISGGTVEIDFTRKELEHLNDELAKAVPHAPGPDKKRLVVVQHRVADLLACDHPGDKPKARGKAPKKSDLLYQFKITLLGIKAPIWRRIQVPDCTLADFHKYIQAAFGWWNYHLYQFEIGGNVFRQPALTGDDFGMDIEEDTNVLLSQMIPKSCQKARWIYEYDFGDCWRHELLFEGFPSAEPGKDYPLCLGGKRACPPEDCGGQWGYADYLAAIRDKKHKQHKEMLEWRGAFDPESFDLNKATMKMRNA